MLVLGNDFQEKMDLWVPLEKEKTFKSTYINIKTKLSLC